MAKKPSQPKKVTRPILSRESRMVLYALAAFVVVRGIAGMIDTGGQRLWGIDFYSMYDGTWMALVAWLPLLFALPSISARFVGASSSSAHADEAKERGKGTPAIRLLLAAGLTLFAGWLAYEINVGYAFLGDGTWYPAELLRSMTLPDYANSMIKPSAWLTGLLLDTLAVRLQPEDIRLPFILAGVAGAVIATGSLLLAMRREQGKTVLMTALLFLAPAGSLVFLGYIELYAIVYGLSIAYLVSAWECLRGDVPVWFPGMFLLLAILFGASSIVWLPSYLLLLHWKVRGESGSFPLRRAAMILIILPPLAALLAVFLLPGNSDSAYLVAFSPYERMVEGFSTGWQRYVFTAGARWIDIINVLFLTLGPVLAVLPVLFVLAMRRRILTLPSVLLGLTAASGGLTLLLFGNTFLGLARDWDVAALAVLGCFLLATVLLKSLHSHGALQLPALLPMLAAAMLSQLVLWTAVNVNDDASARRFAQLAEMDEGVVLPMNSFTAWENLRKFYKSGGEQQPYFHAMRKLIETGYRRDVSYAEYLSAALQLRDAGKQQQEMRWLLETLLGDAKAESQREHATVDRRFFREFSMRALLSAWQTGHQDLVRAVRPSFESRFASWPEKQLLLPLQQSLSQEEIRQILDSAVSEDTDDAFLLMTAGGYAARYDLTGEADRLYARALKREPTQYPSWYLVAARLQMQLQNREKARQYLEACITNAPSSMEARQAESLLSQL
ncbi:hypothetical protein KQI65_11400 [bacterium]|nr:hypothetical protein [bacterium]